MYEIRFEGVEEDGPKNGQDESRVGFLITATTQQPLCYNTAVNTNTKFSFTPLTHPMLNRTTERKTIVYSSKREANTVQTVPIRSVRVRITRVYTVQRGVWYQSRYTLSRVLFYC